MRTAMIVAAALAIAWLPSPGALTQSSSSYELSEHTFNADGHPAGGTIMSSASYRITLDALGDAVAGGGLSGVSYRTDGGFTLAYPPPGEVSELRFSDKQTLHWDPEESVGVYNLYRDLIGSLSPTGSGNCLEYGIVGETTTDEDVPPSGDGYFYLVTAENRLGEEGTKGDDGDGVERPNDAPCP